MTLTIVSAPTSQTLLPSPVTLLHSRDVPHAERGIATGELVRIRRGVLVSGRAWAGLAPWGRYLSRVRAELLVHPDAIPCFESSAVLLGMPVFGDHVTVHVLDSAAATARLFGGVRTHTTRDDREIVEMDGVRLVGVVDTVVDLARARHHAVGLSVADAALRCDRTLRTEMIVAANESRLDIRGRRHARWVTHRATGQAESVLESVSRAVIEWLGFDEPELQHPFTTQGRDDRVDMWWECDRVVGEADGDVKYDGSLQPGVVAIRGEKDRDRRLLRHAHGVAHWGWADLRRVDPVRDELRRAGLRLRHPSHAQPLASLPAALSPR